MPPGRTAEFTQTLHQAQQGDAGAADRLFAETYDEMRELAQRYLQREPAGITLQPTALVHEAYLRLVDQTRVAWQGRTHFFAVGAQAMRRILVDEARRRLAQKRGGAGHRITFQEDMLTDGQKASDVLELNDALEALQKLDPRQARLAELRLFGGLTVAEAAEALGVSKRTVEREWTMARAWLHRELYEGPAG